MPDEGSVSRWIGPLKEGDPAGVEELWQRYFARLVGLARTKLRDAPRRVADEEDVALSAFESFCRNAACGRFPQLNDRDGLWRLLVLITARKAAHLKRDMTRQRRGGGAAAAADEDGGLDQVLSREPTPEFAAQIAEQYERLLQALNDPELEAIAVGRMEGYHVEELGERFGYAPRSIKRKLKMIRSVWERVVPW